MEYIYATLTLNELDQELNQENITAVLEAAGADVIESRVKAIVAALEDVDIEHLGFESEMMQATGGGQVVQTAEARDEIGFTDIDADESETDAELDADAESEEDEDADPVSDLFEDEDDGSAADEESAEADDGEEASPDEQEDR